MANTVLPCQTQKAAGFEVWVYEAFGSLRADFGSTGEERKKDLHSGPKVCAQARLLGHRTTFQIHV